MKTLKPSFFFGLGFFWFCIHKKPKKNHPKKTGCNTRCVAALIHISLSFISVYVLSLIVRPEPVFGRGRGWSKQPGPGFTYYFNEAGSAEVQRRNLGRR